MEAMQVEKQTMEIVDDMKDCDTSLQLFVHFENHMKTNENQ